MGHLAVFAVAILITGVGIWAADVVAKDLGKKDPQIVVIDEVAGVLVTLSVAPPTWGALAAGVVLFRVFDQTKPWPARTAERKLPGGWGIVLDDVAAGVWGVAALLALLAAGIVR
jgi:phosphatidylglycerophosphatase A